MTVKQTPIPKNPIGESFVWRDWFQKLSDRVFGTASSLDVPILPQYGGTGKTSYDVGDILYANGPTSFLVLSKPSVGSLLTMNAAGVPSWKNPKYGAFHDTATQTAAANTPTAITLNTTDISNGVSIGSPTSRVVINTAGLYNIQFSIQFANTSTSTIDDVACWLRVNGSDVSDSNSWIALPTKHAGRNGQLLMALNLFYTFAANDYFELIWMTVNGTSRTETISGSSTPPVHPLTPGIILTVSDNISTQ